MADRLIDLGAAEAAGAIRSRQLSAVDLVTALIDRAQEVDQRIQAWETLDADGALAQARVADALVARSDQTLGPLHGVPFGAKDIFDTAGLRTAANFPDYDQRVPGEDAESVARLKRAGAILLGKTVTTQFAQSDPARTVNPWSELHTPAGSSSGSGAGVSAREMPFALGSQTAGSTLRPAAYTGIVGFKPTFGRFSKRGVIPLAASLDHVGILAREVEDCVLVGQVLAGYDPADPMSALPPNAMPLADTATLAPVIGLWLEALERASERVRTHVLDLAERLKGRGATVRELRAGERLDLVLAVHHVTMQSEAAAEHWQRLDRFADSYAPRLRSYLEVGRLMPAAAYVRAQWLRRRIAASFSRAFQGCDAVLLPTAADVAPLRDSTGDPSLQAPLSLIGFPAISLPGGLTEQGLPLAIQLTAPPWRDEHLLHVSGWVAQSLERLPHPPLAP